MILNLKCGGMVMNMNLDDFKRYITGQVIIIFFFVLGFIIGSILTFQATQAYINANYETFPISVSHDL